MFSAVVGFTLYTTNTHEGKRKKITKECYKNILRLVRDAVRRKRLELWSTGNWLLHHDNAPAHSSHLIQSFSLAKYKTPLVRQAPCDFRLSRYACIFKVKTSLSALSKNVVDIELD